MANQNSDDPRPAASRPDDASLGEPEPVDAEFEPAAPAPKRKRGGPGWILAVLLILIAAAIGGGTAHLINRVLPAGEAAGADAGVEARLVALEAEVSGRPAELDALQARISALEEAFDRLGLRSDALASLDDRVRALEAAQPIGIDEGSPAAGAATERAALRVRLSRLERELAEAVSLAGAAQAAADSALGATRTLQEMGAEAGGEGAQSGPGDDATALAALAGERSDLAARFAALNAAQAELNVEVAAAISAAERARTLAEQALAAASAPQDAHARTTAERALALTALADALTRSGPFELERAALARVWSDAPGLAALEPIARTGAPSFDRLQAQFPREAVLDAAGVRRSFFGLVQVTPSVEDAVGEDPLGLLAAAQTRLDRGDLAGAVEALARLEGAPAEAAQSWLLSARARLDAQSVLTELRAQLSEEMAR